MRAAGSVRDRGVNVGSIDSRVSLKGGAFGVSEIPCAAFCSHLTGALVRPRHRASYLLGVRGSLPCAPVAALLSFVSIYSWSSGLSTHLHMDLSLSVSVMSLHFRYMPLWMHLRHMYPIMYPECIPAVYMYRNFVS